MSSINDYLSKFLSDDLHTNNLFRVNFLNLPGDVARFSEYLTYACKAIELPGLTVIEGKYFFKGHHRKFGINYDIDPINATFRIDGKCDIAGAINAWKNLIVSPDGYIGYKDDYKCDIEIMLLNKNAQENYKIKVFEAYPTNISALSLDWDSSDSVSEITIAFNFDSYERV